MEFFLGKVTQQAMNYAIRSGVTLTATYAIRQSTRLLANAPKSNDRDELYALQQRLHNKIKIISPAIDMVELIAARGNTSLESAVSLTKDLRFDIQSLAQRLGNAAASEESARGGRLSSQTKTRNEAELKLIIIDIKNLLERIEESVPFIQLAIATSGARLSTNLPATISPSRLLQASTFLTAGDTQYCLSPHQAVQIGPTFTLTVYMLFAGHNRPQIEEEIRETTWKEVIHKAKVKLRRVPLDVVIGAGSGSKAIRSTEIWSSYETSHPEADSRIPADSRSDEFAYQLMVVEDFDDDRAHDFDDQEAKPGPFDDVKMAGIREMMPIHEISKIFYADTSKVLNIGTDAEANHPVLLLKRDINAVPPRRMVDREAQVTTDMNELIPQQESEEQCAGKDHSKQSVNSWRFPPSLDPEWIAFEVYTEAEDSDEDFVDASSDSPANDLELSRSMSRLQADTNSTNTSETPNPQVAQLKTQTPPWVNTVRTSLSLLELLLRLTSLQQFQQQPHLSISDEMLNFFLEPTASTGAGENEGHRQALRADARRRVGWDPYDESPLKPRGEEYQYNALSPGLSINSGREAWSPPDLQTRSITAVSDQPSPSPSAPSKDRSAWLKRQQPAKSSPLRPLNRVSDEGIGTSPDIGAG